MAEPMSNDDVGGGGLGSREYMIGGPGIGYRDEQATSLRIQQLGAVPGTRPPDGLGPSMLEEEEAQFNDAESVDSFRVSYPNQRPSRSVGAYGPMGTGRSRWDETPEAAERRIAEMSKAAGLPTLMAAGLVPAMEPQELAGLVHAMMIADRVASNDVILEGAEAQELRELRALQEEHQARRKREQEELERLRAWKAELATEASTASANPRAVTSAALSPAVHFRGYAQGRSPGAPSVADRRASLQDSLGPVQGGLAPPHTPARTRMDPSHDGPMLSPAERSVRQLSANLDRCLAAQAPAGAQQLGISANSAVTPHDGGSAVELMARSVSSLVAAMQERESGTTLRWDRKRPIVKAETAESLLHEEVMLENIYAEMGYKTYRKKWSVFRPSLEGKAKETVELELEEHGIKPDMISTMDEVTLKNLHDYLIAVLEVSVSLTAEKKAEISMGVMEKVRMHPNSGPAGAEKFIQDYKNAYLLQLRAKLVETTPTAVTMRLFDYKARLAPEVQKYIKGLPESEQPQTLADMHDVVRRWAERERTGQPHLTRRERREQAYALQEKGRKAVPKSSASAAHSGTVNVPIEYLQNLFQSGSIAQALMKPSQSGKGAGQESGPSIDWSQKSCFVCGGKHLEKLRGKEHCPNKIAEEKGTAAQNKASNVKCTMWVDSKKTQCGGQPLVGRAQSGFGKMGSQERCTERQGQEGQG